LRCALPLTFGCYRLARFNGIEAEALYHPPPLAGRYRDDGPGRYGLVVGRLDAWKRMDLAIEGAAALKDEAARRVAPIPGSGARAEPQALRRASPRRGIERRRTPEAAKTAFATAGAAAMMGVSPPPAGGMSRFSTR